MLKILQIIPALNKGGAERLVLDICNELQKNNKVKLICFRSDNAYKFLSDTIDYEVIASSVTPSIIGNPKIYVGELQNFIDQFKPNVIHSHLFEAEMVLSEINYTRAKYFTHFHDNMVQLAKPRLNVLYSKTRFTNAYERKIVLKSFKRKNSQFISISKDTQKYVKDNLPANHKSHLLYNAIDLIRFSNDAKNRKRNNLTMIGSLVEKKGQDLAIETVAELKNRGIECVLNLLGDGPKRGILREKVNNLNLDKLVHFHGNVDYPEQYLGESSIYLHTASYEPFGLVLIEAMAAGLPIVCSDGGGNRDIVLEEQNGFMIWDRDSKKIADKIELLLSDEDLRLKMSRNAAKFSENYDIINYVDNLLELYKEK